MDLLIPSQAIKSGAKGQILFKSRKSTNYLHQKAIKVGKSGLN